MVERKSLTDDDGNISWTSIVGTLFGGWAIAVGAGTASVIDTFTTQLSEAISNVTAFNASLINLGFEMLSGGIDGSWDQMAAAAQEAGPLGLLLLGAEVLVVAWLLSVGRERYA